MLQAQENKLYPVNKSATKKSLTRFSAKETAEYKAYRDRVSPPVVAG